VFQAVVLGAVQGLTEFIPVSSSGHLVVVPAAFGWAPPGLAFDVLLHVASLLALVAYFSGDLLDLTRGVFSNDRDARRLLLLLVVGTVPAVIAGLVLGDFFEEAFEDAPSAAIQIVITAVILMVAEQVFARHERTFAQQGRDLRRIGDLKATDAGLIGVAQAISILPGISRSGATIGMGLGLKVGRAEAARFAFLLAIPALLGASVIQIPELGETTLGVGAGVAGFVTSLAASYAAIWGLIRYLRTNTLYPFAAYCVVAGILFYVFV
jgi:undecaprenyl-diphosphatase